MMKIKHAAVGIYILTMASGGVVLADCPHNLPEKLLEDCLIFPADDYAHMDEYQAWLKTQQPGAQSKTPQKVATKMTAASKSNN